MRLLSQSLAVPGTVHHRGHEVRTGIFKEPVAGAVFATRMGLRGDLQADRSVHGGQQMAVYAYPSEHYAKWSDELGERELPHGHFGENWTTEGLIETEISIGDRFRVGEAVVEVSQPRVPCFKLAAKLDRPDFPKVFLASRKVGWYFRVLREGSVTAGDELQLEERAKQRLTIDDVIRLRFFERNDLAGAAMAAEHPGLSPEWQEMFAAMR